MNLKERRNVAHSTPTLVAHDGIVKPTELSLFSLREVPNFEAVFRIAHPQAHFLDF